MPSRAISRLPAIHVEACYAFYDYTFGKRLQYWIYHWNLLLKEVSHDLHASLFQAFACTSNTCCVAFLIVHRVARLCDALVQKVVLLFALVYSFVGLRCHVLNYDTAFFWRRVSRDDSDGTVFELLQSLPGGSDDSFSVLSVLHPDVYGAIAYFSGLPLLYVRDAKLYLSCLSSLCSPGNTVYAALILFLFAPDTVYFLSRFYTFYSVLVLGGIRREGMTACKCYIASVESLGVKYYSWQSSCLCHHASGCFQHRRGNRIFRCLDYTIKPLYKQDEVFYAFG